MLFTRITLASAIIAAVAIAPAHAGAKQCDDKKTPKEQAKCYDDLTQKVKEQVLKTIVKTCDKASNNNNAVSSACTYDGMGVMLDLAAKWEPKK